MKNLPRLSAQVTDHLSLNQAVYLFEVNLLFNFLSIVLFLLSVSIQTHVSEGILSFKCLTGQGLAFPCRLCARTTFKMQRLRGSPRRKSVEAVREGSCRNPRRFSNGGAMRVRSRNCCQELRYPTSSVQT